MDAYGAPCQAFDLLPPVSEWPGTKVSTVFPASSKVEQVLL